MSRLTNVKIPILVFWIDMFELLFLVVYIRPGGLYHIICNDAAFQEMFLRKRIFDQSTK